MGFDIYIGQGVGKARMKNGKLDVSKMEVERTHHDSAPTFPNDEVTGNGNSRHPSYTVWGEFTRSAGLEELFFDKKTGLMREHPGAQVLTFEHRDIIRQALADWKINHPDSKPGFEGHEFDSLRTVLDFTPDHTLARLIWLDYWVNWTVENCEFPVIYNF
jgi:hypothetical protein